MLYNIIDSDAKFQYDHEVSEEVLYQMFCNTIYFYQLIINLAFDQEKELRMRLFWCCTNKHKEEAGSSDTCIWLYGLDLNTQNEIIKGIRKVEKIRQEEQQKYFEINEENNELSVKEEWKEKMYKFINSPSIYDSTKKDIENILKVKLNNSLI